MIHEDPDDLGYWIDQTYGDWQPTIKPPVDTLAICNTILPPFEQSAIVAAASCSELDGQAEKLRSVACYDFTWRYADRQYRGLPTGRLP